MTAPATQHEDDILGKAYDRKLMRRLLVYTRPYRALMYGAFALLCVEGAIQVVGPLRSGYFQLLHGPRRIRPEFVQRNDGVVRFPRGTVVFEAPQPKLGVLRVNR